MPNQPIRIGTRDSPLALWQANTVAQLLQEQGAEVAVAAVKSDGDLDLITPLYAMGVQGVFSKTLDTALLNKRIDIAVHSMKDVPVQLAQGIVQGAVLARGPVADLLVYRADMPDEAALQNGRYTIGTGSLRRSSQWLHRYPRHHTENLRGNVATRLHKLAESQWLGAIFAQAGLQRMHQLPSQSIQLDWMLPAPAQGAIMVVCREEDQGLYDILQKINHAPTATCVAEERALLQQLHGGCSTPIGALATIDGTDFRLEANIVSLDGTKEIRAKLCVPIAAAAGSGASLAAQMLQQGAGALVEAIRKALP